MDKKEIIEVLQKMLTDYKSVLDCQTYETLLARCRNLYIQLGFCNWLSYSDHYGYMYQILIELSYDSMLNYQQLEGYWYPIVADNIEVFEEELNDEYFTADYVIILAIKPRIANIERTITRLENEILNDQKKQLINKLYTVGKLLHNARKN